jgi:hypothetical protein
VDLTDILNFKYALIVVYLNFSLRDGDLMKRLQGCHGNSLALPLNPMSWLLKTAVDVCTIGSSLHLVNHRSEFSFLHQLISSSRSVTGTWNLKLIFKSCGIRLISIEFITFSLPLAEDRLSQGHGHRSTARSANRQRLHSPAGHQCRLEQVIYLNLN